jgi:hypothetical protein
MKDVKELSKAEIEQLQWSYFYAEEIEHKYHYPHDIPYEIILSHYKDISFVDEDFFCNIIN